MEKEKLKECRTSNLWLQYMDQIDTLKKFIAGERLGDWKLHLSATADMEYLMAATGHNLYAKSIHVYLQRMQKLPETNPEVYKSFMEGLHVVRRSDLLLVGLSTDLVIEQVLMRSLKSTGGLTRGRGMSEVQTSI